MNSKITPRQQRFVEEYLVDLNATQAAIRAGYSSKTAHSAGPRLLANVDVAAAIEKAKQARSEETNIDSVWVLRQAVEIHERAMSSIRPCLHPKTRKHVHDAGGNALYVFSASAATRALELIGRHVAVNAFSDKLELSGGISVAERIMAGRERVRMARVASPADAGPKASG